MASDPTLRRVKYLAALLPLLTSAACAPSGVIVDRVTLPPVPPALSSLCDRPDPSGFIEVDAALHLQALATCHDRHRDLTAWYGDVRDGLAQP